jgi:hypothetical protein
MAPHPVKLGSLLPAGALLLLALPGALAAQGGGHAGHAGHAAAPDSAFRALQQRGKVAMGVDQYTSVHRFDDFADGGRIELQRGAGDTAGVRTIREHLQAIARAFASGDFSTPAFVHMREVPGTAEMARLRAAIRYDYSPLPGGGQLRITTTNPRAIEAVHRFMAFQRGDHRAGGAASPPRQRR